MCPKRPLCHFILIALLVNAITGWLIPFARNTSLLAGWFARVNPTFWQANSGELLLKLGATLLVIALLLIVGYPTKTPTSSPPIATPEYQELLHAA